LLINIRFGQNHSKKNNRRKAKTGGRRGIFTRRRLIRENKTKAKTKRTTQEHPRRLP